MLQRFLASKKNVLKQFSLSIALLFFCITLASCGGSTTAFSANLETEAGETTPVTAAEIPEDAELATAIFAGGCFWCMEGPFDKIDGVISTTSGYTGGQAENPTYGQVSAGITGHTESVQIVYDSNQVDFATLLKTYWVNVDPLDAKGQFCDKGSQYRSAIFYENEQEKQLAEASKAEAAEKLAQNFDQITVDSIATEITAASTFYPAEDYHQDYYIKNPVRYKIYRTGCGRDRRLTQLWGDAAAH